MIKSLITEYGLPWIFNRSLYSLKLKMMRAIPLTEKMFEKKVNIKRIDIFDIDVNSLEDFLITLSESKKNEIIDIANKAIEGKIIAFSSIELDFGNPFNWHFNPITKVEVENSLKWYKIPDFDADRGDIKIIWEASRFTHFYYFIRAYLLTKNYKYYKAFSDQLEGWIENNIYSYGANYKCGQEATLRMINAIVTYSAFEALGLSNQKDKNNLYKLIEGSYNKVLSNFFYAHKCIKNNHTLSEITGLIIGAWCCEDEVKLMKAYKLLEKEIDNQFFSDGGYVQYSFNYQRFALQIMEFNLKISKKTNISISEKSKKLIRNSIMLMYQMQDKEGDLGELPNYGSNDGALIFPVSSCDYRDYRPVINTINVLLGGDRIFYNGEYDEEIIWFSEKKIDDIPITNIKKVSSHYNKSGFFSLRNKNSFIMIVLQNFKTRPAQMDQLHVDIWYKGKNILCDSGTFSYATDIGKQLALTSAHNTVKIDNKEQMKKHGPFLIYDWTSSIDIEHNEDYFCGTMVSKNGYKHKRRIEKIDNGFIIKDIVYSEGERCEFNFHTPYEVRVNKNGFEIIDDEVVLATVNTDSKIELKKTYRSLYYLIKQEITNVSVIKKIENKKCNIFFDIQLG